MEHTKTKKRNLIFVQVGDNHRNTLLHNHAYASILMKINLWILHYQASNIFMYGHLMIYIGRKDSYKLKYEFKDSQPMRKSR